MRSITEVPTEFYAQVLGPHRKYSACHWGPNPDMASCSLDAAEARALELTYLHAGLKP